MSKTKGKIVVISGPSGTGKNTVFDALLLKCPELAQTISVTTRAPRPDEKNGVDYYFVTRDEFEHKIERGEFLEYAVYGKNYYGTLKSEVEGIISCNKTVVLIIEVNGALNVKKVFPDAITIFILPPSQEVLRKRIISRGTNSTDDIENRLSIAVDEMQMRSKYDYCVVNDDLENCVSEIYSIIEK